MPVYQLLVHGFGRHTSCFPNGLLYLSRILQVVHHIDSSKNNWDADR